MIDWERHLGPDGVAGGLELLKALAAMPRRQEPGTLAAEMEAGYRAYSLDSAMEGIILRLRSRHIPDWARGAFRLPWSGLDAWQPAWRDRERVEGAAAEWRVSVMEAFASRHADALMGEVSRMREALTAAAADGNGRDGLLARDARGGCAHLTLRVPAAAEARVRALLAEVWAAEPAMGRAEVEERLAAATPRLAALGVTRLVLYGSAARGEAAPCSDVDLAYEGGADDAWALWDDLRAELEATLGKVVDLRGLAALEGAAAEGAVVVWQR